MAKKPKNPKTASQKLADNQKFVEDRAAGRLTPKQISDAETKRAAAVARAEERFPPITPEAQVKSFIENLRKMFRRQ